MSSNNLRTSLNVDGIKQSNEVRPTGSFNIYPGHSEITYRTYLVPVNQVESYASIELLIENLRDGHNNNLIEETVTFELLQ